MATSFQRSTENTVFVRFIPPSSNVRRHHLEDAFSQIGPIKKSSVIAQPNGSSYAFCKFTRAIDAEAAANRLNRTKLKVSDTETVQLRVELASNQRHKPAKGRDEVPPAEDRNPKRDSRLILRNLSFYAKEAHIRKALQPFGKIVEVHIPAVPGATHRGFAFVTFASASQAQACLQAETILVKDRPVKVAFSLDKTTYESKKGRTDTAKKSEVVDESEEEDDTDEVGSESEDSGSDSDGSGSDDDDGSESQDNEEDEDENHADKEMNDEETEDAAGQPKKDDNAVAEKRCLFLRNLPFDAGRQDVFDVFVKFGYVQSIYLVRDSATGIAKGTAFVTFRNAKAADKAIEASKSGSSFVSLKEAGGGDSGGDQGGISIKGRRVFVDLAVDKSTASTLTMEKQASTKVAGKDRRNLYLKNEGRVDNDPNSERKAWNELPEQDQAKRQRAWSEKNTKLRSPLFFVNPTRLSIRNLAKTVDESDLKKLVVHATQRGLRHVSAEDQIAHWRAAGDWTTREVLAKVQEASDKKTSILPDFDEKNIRKYIPSVFLEREGRKDAPSRGFGFVEFLHHAHALACLRELNNNPFYSKEYVQGGRHAMEGKKRAEALVPRLIVDFAVENKAKAKHQTERRAQQQANYLKQKELHDPKPKKESKETKKSRGAAQREKKRKLKNGEVVVEEEPAPQPKAKDIKPAKVQQPKSKGIKPRKKAKREDPEDAKFSKLVDSYKEAFSAPKQTIVGEKKRWFE